MVSLSDDLADFPIEVREKLFESHVKPFGAHITDRKVFGKKYETKYPDLPNPYKYEKDKAKDKLGPRTRKALIQEPLKLYEKPKSPRPEYYAGANKSDFDEQKRTLKWSQPFPMVYILPDGTVTTKPPPDIKEAAERTMDSEKLSRLATVKSLYEQKYK